MVFSYNSFLTRILLLPTVLSQFCQPIRPNSDNAISIQNCKTYYQLVLDVGTPSTSYIFLIDTGSHRTWLPTTTCRCGPGINTQTSLTANMTNIPDNITYADGDKVFGFEGTQAFSFENTPIKSVTSQLVFVTKKQAPLTVDMGIIALGYEQNNIFDEAFRQGKTSSDVFTLVLSDEDHKSFLYFNHLPADIVQNNVYSQLLPNSPFWSIKCYGVRIQGNDFSKYANKNIIVDSGTTVTNLNTQLFQAVANTFLKNCSATERGFVCPFGIRLPILQFYLQGNIVYLDPDHYSQIRSFRTEVYLNKSPNIILGTSFFKKYAITFDKRQNRIGFFGESEPLSVIGDSFFYGSTITMLIILGIVVVMAFVSSICSCFYSNSKKQSAIPQTQFHYPTQIYMY